MQGRVVSGHKEALQQVQRMAVAEGALKVAPLAVSGAFHTPLMQTAQDNLKQACPSTLSYYIHVTQVSLVLSHTALCCKTCVCAANCCKQVGLEPVLHQHLQLCQRT